MPNAYVCRVAAGIVIAAALTAGRYTLQIRWDADAGRFWVFRISANTWR
jgi:hypothetical protein